MTTKVTVSFRAAVARLNRQLAKEGEKLMKFRTPLDGIWDYGIVSTANNGLVWKGNHENLLNWIAESGVLKPYEAIAED